jgi:sulfide dehydrogenase cytochrome subunit
MADGPELMGGASAEMLANTCAGCHGTNGASNGPATPTIAGLSNEYFVEVMLGFKTAETPSTIMTRIAKGYSEDEIKAMASYFAKKPFVKAKQPFDEAAVRKGGKLHDKYCEKCHANAGQLPEDDSGILAGQWSPYLSATMADYVSGKREMTKKMRKKVKKLLDKEGEEGMKTLLNFYASQQ